MDWAGHQLCLLVNALFEVGFGAEKGARAGAGAHPGVAGTGEPRLGKALFCGEIGSRSSLWQGK